MQNGIWLNDVNLVKCENSVGCFCPLHSSGFSHLVRKEFRLSQNPIANTLEPKDSESCCIEVAAVVCVLNESHGKSTEGQHMCFVHLSDLASFNDQNSDSFN